MEEPLTSIANGLIDSMMDFAARFARLKQVLDDPESLFPGAEMRDELLALVNDVPDRASEAWLFRELAVLEGKRRVVDCLDYADRALAAQEETNVLSPERLYFMYLICGDVGTDWDGGPRTKMHLDRALRLHAELGRPVEEAFKIRINQGVCEWSAGSARLGLDWFEPLLEEARDLYGDQSPALSHLLWLMSRSEEKLGNISAALAYGRRSLDLVDDTADRGRRVSASATHAELLFRAGKKKEAKQLLDDAMAFAQAHCSKATQDFAREEKDRLLLTETSPVRSMINRLKGAFSNKG